MGIIRYILNDKEIQELRKKWEAIRTDPFPPFHKDTFGNTVKYKEYLRTALTDSHSYKT